MSNRTFKAGDTVRHKPTGETWHLIEDQQGEHVIPGGWPRSMGKAADCELIETCEQKDARAELVYMKPGARGLADA